VVDRQQAAVSGISVDRAFILAGGLGTRLRPLTEHTPKCLVPLEGEPLLGIWLDELHELGVEHVRVNTHHLAAQVDAFAAGRKAPRCETVYEPALLGSAGTLHANRDFFAAQAHALVLYGDNYAPGAAGELLRTPLPEGCVARVGFFESPEPESCGIGRLDDQGLLVEFEEKPARPRSNLAFGGLLLVRPALLDQIGASDFDIGTHVLPKLLGIAEGWRIERPILDIGSPERRERARAQRRRDLSTEAGECESS